MYRIALIALFVSLAFPALASDVTVTESHTSFDTEAVTLRPGSAIVFANKDNITHDIHVSDADNDEGVSEDKGLQKPGQDLKVMFPHSGVYKVYCAINPNMRMTVTVQ